MKKVIGIGEIVYDIVFENDNPVKAVPGGSVFNCLISLGRSNIPAFLVSETGSDRVGNIIKNFMKENNLSTDYIDFFRDGSSPVSLAFLDEDKNAAYTFYRNFPEERLNIDIPVVNKNDVVVFGSYFAVVPILREKVLELLNQARDKDAIVYYDINFRKTHAHECMKLTSSFLENFEFSDIIRCSDEDLSVLYPGESVDDIYRQRISFYSKIFIVTQTRRVLLKTGHFEKQYETKPLTPVSTIGAGDSFNAGLLYGLMKYDISKEELGYLEEKEWDKIITLAIEFASETCMQIDNYISNAFAMSLDMR